MNVKTGKCWWKGIPKVHGKKVINETLCGMKIQVRTWKEVIKFDDGFVEVNEPITCKKCLKAEN